MNIEEKVIRAYSAAASHRDPFWVVSIHVSQDVVDWLKSKMATVDDSAAGRPWLNPTLWGYPVVVERGWEPGRVSVRAEMQIL